MSKSESDKPLVWLHTEIQTPPFSREARLEAGVLLRRLQRGEAIDMPQSRPMPTIGRGCHELRIRDRDNNWRIIYRIDRDAIVLLKAFKKKSAKTPGEVIRLCKTRLKDYDNG